MNSRDQVCILNDCRYKKNNEQKVQFDKFLYKLEIVPEKWDEAKNIFICLRHLHLMSNKKTDCQKYWLENKSLPNEFVVGNRGVPKTYHLRKYRKLQQKSHRNCQVIQILKFRQVRRRTTIVSCLFPVFFTQNLLFLSGSRPLQWTTLNWTRSSGLPRQVPFSRSRSPGR